MATQKATYRFLTLAQSKINKCVKIHNTWGQFFFDRKPATIILRLNRDALQEKLIPNAVAPKLGSKDHKGHIPYIEAWYPEPIPFSAIDSFMLVQNKVAEEVSATEIGKSSIPEFEKLLI